MNCNCLEIRSNNDQCLSKFLIPFHLLYVAILTLKFATMIESNKEKVTQKIMQRHKNAMVRNRCIHETNINIFLQDILQKCMSACQINLT